MRWRRRAFSPACRRRAFCRMTSSVRDLLIVAATETVTDEDCDAYAKALAEVLR